jgi:hypothetical protein
MIAIYLFVALVLPGMSEPMVDRTPVATIEECSARVAIMHESIKKYYGEEFKFVAACQFEGTKAIKS